uniref:Transferrin receptor 2 n=1 Tax=Cyprinus carpio TaxID=7962 RepID=A0A8C1NIH2_CYPCA
MMDSVTGLISGAAGGGAQANEGVEEGGGVRRRVPPIELKLVPLEEGSEVTLNSDVMILQRQMDRRKAVVYLTLSGLLIFTTAFLLGYVAFRGMCRLCGNDGELIPLSDAAGAQHAPEGGVMYMAELREMLKKYLTEERIESTLRRVSRASHPPGSSEGNAVAREILQNLQNLRMDHTWTDSHYATLQFPSRTQPNTLWLVDSEGEELEEIPLDSEGYCAYSATGTATGGVVYVNYGRREDFEQLRALGVALNGSIAVARVGGAVSFAEKVWHAQEAGHVGVLIYPDPADVPQDPRRLGLHSNAVISEHVHLGSGDPFTPGFPSFNHTQFPSTQSSGLPIIPAQPISANVASKLLSQLSGSSCPRGWQGRLPYVQCVLGPGFTGPGERRVKMAVYNTMKPVLLNNIFASIEGKIEPDHYIIIGAQRDSWGPGAVKSGVGTALLMELARTFSNMVENGFSPRRSLLFVSWDGGEFGNVGATEWLEGYLTMLHLKAVAYFSLDQAILGDDILSVYSSPLLADLIEGAIKQVEHPKHTGQSILSLVQRQGGWRNIVKPLYLNSGAYSFTAFGGVPAMQLHFTEVKTALMSIKVRIIIQVQIQRVTIFKNHVSLSLSLSLSLSVCQSRGLSPQWVFSARGDYSRAAKNLHEAIKNSDIQDERLARLYNTRIMRVEYYFLSQYVSVVETPFRHVFNGRGDHTLSALADHVSLLRSAPHLFNEARFRRQLALFTWTLQGAANALSGDVWNIDNPL